MKENFNTLRQRATQIKNEVEDGANTSARVGSFCEDVVDTMTIFNAHSEPGVIFKFFSASQQSIRRIYPA